MISSPKNIASNLTNSTTDRGVEAKEIEIANIRLDDDASSSSRLAAAAAARCEPAAGDAPPGADDSGSFVQVVVHKHRRAGGAAERVARASSPLPRAPGGCACACGACAGDGRVVLLSHPLLLTWPGRAPPRWARGEPFGADETTAEPSGRALREDVPRGAPSASPSPPVQAARGAAPGARDDDGGGGGALAAFGWTRAGERAAEEDPECVEVFEFERDYGDLLCAREWAGAGGGVAGRVPALERAARRAGRPLARALGEVLAAPRLLAALALHVALAGARCALATVRGAWGGALQALSDQALKPALALVFNGAVRPPLVFVRATLRALREALQPLWGALGDALEPAARLLAAARLVHVHVQRAPPAPPQHQPRQGSRDQPPL